VTLGDAATAEVPDVGDAGAPSVAALEAAEGGAGEVTVDPQAATTTTSAATSACPPPLTSILRATLPTVLMARR
jgi:hypothetical protein